MRTTLSLDDDLAKSIENFRKRKNLSLREVVNQLLREGLQATSTSATLCCWDSFGSQPIRGFLKFRLLLRRLSR